MDNTVVRRLQPGDADEVRRISLAITQSQEKIDFARIVRRQTQSEDHASFVAERDNRLVGYCISYVLSGSFGIEKSALVAMIGIDPVSMGQGIGHMLATAVLTYYRENGVQDIYTSVRWDSTDLLSFFKTLGFQRSDFINLHKRLD